jgi:hypothetical protein
MTSQSPRIYLYKITFEEVPYYYYGVHKEKKYNEYYVGSPVSHKWCWELYTPKKQILEFFNCWEEAQEVEKRLIKPFYNTDKWCLNENVGGVLSLEVYRKGGRISGKINGKRNRENKIGICGMSFEEKSAAGKKGGKKTAELKVGFHGMSLEEKSENGKMGAKRAKELGVGIFSLLTEQLSENGKKGGKISGQKNKENKTGICGFSKEQRSETGKKVAFQRWMCLETGFVTNAGNLTKYQKARNIDTSKRIKIE